MFTKNSRATRSALRHSQGAAQRLSVSNTIKKSLDSLQSLEQRDIWRKIRVGENGVIVEKEFYHNFKKGS